MTIMKIWHTTVGAAVFTALLVCGMAWPYDESESVSLEDVDYPAESQENMMEDQYYIGEKYCNFDNSLVYIATSRSYWTE